MPPPNTPEEETVNVEEYLENIISTATVPSELRNQLSDTEFRQLLREALVTELANEDSEQEDQQDDQQQSEGSLGEHSNPDSEEEEEEDVSDESAQSEDDENSTADLQTGQTPPLDFHNLTYVSEYDENLNCPICQSPLVDPVMLRCMHVFCDKCITESLRHSDACPVDRDKIAADDAQGKAKQAHRIIRNQLDNLRVQCPNTRCDTVCARGSIGYHYNNDCLYTKVPCPDDDCDGLVNRFESNLPCLHQELECVECGAPTNLASLVDHLATNCTGERVPCQFCKAEMHRCEESAHASVCTERRVECCNNTAGCPFSAKRKDLGEHEAHCVYGLIAQLSKAHREEMTGLRQELAQTQDQVRQLEAERSKTSSPTAEASSEMEWDAEQVDAGGGNSDGSTAEASNSGSVLPDAVMTLDEKVDLALTTVRNLEAKLETIETYVGECATQQRHVLMSDIVPLHESVHALNAGFGRLHQHMAKLVEAVYRTPKRPGNSNGSNAATDSNNGTSGISQTTGPSGSRSDENGFLLPRYRQNDRENPPRL